MKVITQYQTKNMCVYTYGCMHVYKYSQLYCIDCTLEFLYQEKWGDEKLRGKVKSEDRRILIRERKNQREVKDITRKPTMSTNLGS